jgi:hypothetical protein
MKENHSGELLFSVERAVSGGRQDIASMAAMAMFWNRNYCVDFLDEMMLYCGKEDNILAQNLWHLLGSKEMISVSRLWSVFHLSIVMPTRWLAAETHKLGEFNWGYISMGHVMDKLKEHLESILEQPELIHDESFMMGFVSDFRDELPPFDDYMTHKFELETTSFIACTASATKAVPLQMLRKELFQPTDQDNKESTGLLEELAVTAARA